MIKFLSKLNCFFILKACSNNQCIMQWVCLKQKKFPRIKFYNGHLFLKLLWTIYLILYTIITAVVFTITTVVASHICISSVWNSIYFFNSLINFSNLKHYLKRNSQISPFATNFGQSFRLFWSKTNKNKIHIYKLSYTLYTQIFIDDLSYDLSNIMWLQILGTVTMKTFCILIVRKRKCHFLKNKLLRLDISQFSRFIIWGDRSWL